MYEPRLKVDGIEVPGITEIVPGPEPLWGDGTGRNAMDGHYSGTFIGYFTTLEIKFEKVTDKEFNLIKSLLEHPFLAATFQIEKDIGNHKQGDWVTEEFYNGASIKATPLTCGGYWGAFSIVLTAIDRREQLT